MRILRVLVACALVASLCLGAFASGAPAQPRRVHRLRLQHHVDPLRVKPPKHRGRRPLAHTSAFATSWPCTPQTTDRAPLLSNAPQVKVVYAYPQGASPNASDYDVIQGDAAAVRDHIQAESGNRLMVRFDVGGAGPSCDANSRNELDIQTVQLAQTASFYASDTFNSVIDELKTKLVPAYPHQRVNYVVYLDNVHPSDTTIAGQGDLNQDSSHGYTNSVNQGRNGDGRLFALIYGVGSATGFGFSDDSRRATFLHEMSHTLGAVQDTAPHSSLAGHCYDVEDVMCYDDGGPYFAGGGSLVTDCSSASFSDLPLDCGKDDYFNASPAAGSYLATSWNEADSVFLCQVAECDSDLTGSPPTVALSASHPGGRLTLTASTTNGPFTHFEWNVNGDGVYESDTGSTPTLQPRFTLPRANSVEVRAVKADGTFAYTSMPLTPTDPEPSLAVGGNLVAGGQVTLDGSATSDPDGLIEHFRWDPNGDGDFGTDTGLTRTLTTSYPIAGTQVAGLEVDYSYGWSRTAIQFSIRPASSTPTSSTPSSGTGATVAAPSITVRTLRLRKLLSGGLPLRISCGNPCVASFRLVVDARTAKRLHLGRRAVTIGRVTGQFAAGTVRPVLGLTRSAKRALRRARQLSASLKGSIRQSSVKPLTVDKRLTFKR